MMFLQDEMESHITELDIEELASLTDDDVEELDVMVGPSYNDVSEEQSDFTYDEDVVEELNFG